MRAHSNELGGVALGGGFEEEGSQGAEDGDVVEQVDVEKGLVLGDGGVGDAGFVPDYAGVGYYLCMVVRSYTSQSGSRKLKQP